MAIGWHEDLVSSVTQLQPTHERFTAIKLSSETASHLIISLYAPTSGKDDEFMECLSHLTEFILSNKSENDSIILGADTNCSERSSGRRRKSWKMFCESFHLEENILPAPTFHHHKGSSETSIDRILTSKLFKLKNLQLHCTLEFPLNLSSHDALTTSVFISVQQRSRSRFQHTYTDFIREKILWDKELLPKYQTLASSALQEAEELWNTPETIPLLCSLLPNLPVKCAKLVFEVKTASETKSLKTKKKSKMLRMAEKELTRTHRVWKKSGKPSSNDDQTRIQYSEARSNLQRRQRYEENLVHVKVNNKLMNANIHDRQQVIGTMKYLRREKVKQTRTR